MDNKTTSDISWWRTNFDEREANRIAQSIAGEHISQGAVTAEFEQKISGMLGIPYVVATTSGSMALLMALMTAGVGPGDEVIIPDRAWIAAAHAVLLLGAKVVLTDVEKERPVMDLDQIEAKITSRTKVIMPVHLNGRSLDMNRLNAIAAKRNVLVIEDAAQAFYSKNSSGFLGCQSYAGCFSLSVAKIISTAQGGFVVTKDKKVYEKLKSLRTQGVNDFIHVSYGQFGFNFRFTDIQASIGLVQLERLPERIAHLKAIYSKYEKGLSRFPFLKFIPVDLEAGEIPVYIDVLLEEREKLLTFFTEHHIQVRPFYPDLNSASYLNQSPGFAHSKRLGEQGLFLPCGPAQPMENIERVLEVLKKYS
jgi:dTDP-4-amino-4,6-dideoxygalactose transaminase